FSRDWSSDVCSSDLVLAHADAHTVGVGIGGHYQRCACFLAFCYDHCHGGFFFRVRRLNRREISIWFALLFYDVDVRKAYPPQALGHHRNTRAMNSRICQRNIVLSLNDVEVGDKLSYFFIIRVFYLAAYGLYKFRPRLEFHLREITDLIHLTYDILVVRRHHLPTIRPVYFVPVVFFWVMRCGDHNASLALEISDSKRQERGGAKFGKEPHDYSIGRHNIGGDTGKIIAVVPAIISYGNGHLLTGICL